MRQFAKSSKVFALAFGLLALNTLSCSDHDQSWKKKQISLPVVVYPTILDQIGRFDSVTLNAVSSPMDLASWADRGSSDLGKYFLSESKQYIVYNYARCNANTSCHHDHPNDQQVIVDLSIINVNSSAEAVDDILTTYYEECYYHDEEVCDEICDETCYEECTDNYEYDYDENGEYYEYYVDTTCVETGCETSCYTDYDNCWLESVLDECVDIPEYHEVTRLTYRASSTARLNVSHLDLATGRIVDVYSRDITKSDTLVENEPGYGKYPSDATEKKFKQKIFDGMMVEVKHELHSMLDYSMTYVSMTPEDDIKLTRSSNTISLSINMPGSAFNNTYEVRIYSSVKYVDSDNYVYREELPVTKSNSYFRFDYDKNLFVNNVGSKDSAYIAIYSGNEFIGGYNAKIRSLKK